MSPEQRTVIERNLEHHRLEVSEVEADLANLKSEGGGSINEADVTGTKALARADLLGRLRDLIAAYERVLAE